MEHISNRLLAVSLPFHADSSVSVVVGLQIHRHALVIIIQLFYTVIGIYIESESTEKIFMFLGILHKSG